MKVIAFNGGPRKDGNTYHLLRHAMNALEAEGVATELVQVGGIAVHGCTACFQCRKNKNGRCVIDSDPINDWIARMVDADGVLLGSPTYFADVTPEMKALIDRIGFVNRSNDGPLKRKIGAAVIAVRRCGAIHAFDTINHFFLIAEMIIPGSNYWNMGFGGAKGDVEDDAEGVATMSTLGTNMAWLLKRIGSGEST